MKNIIEGIISLPKSVYYNFKFLPFKQALKTPLAVRYDTTIISLGGGKIIVNNSVGRFSIKLGFSQVPVCDKQAKTYIQISNKGILHFQGAAHIGHGTKICAHGCLVLGDEFAISSNASIYCYKKIEFGKNCLLGWDVLVMDSDSHKIFDVDGREIPNTKPIKVGEKVWLCYGITVLKGAVIPNNCVIGAKSLIIGNNYRENSIIAGNPAKCIKHINSWEI